MKAILYINPVEPAILSIRTALGVDLDFNVEFRDQVDDPVDPTPFNPVLCLLPRSQGGVRKYDIATYDEVNGIGFVKVPAADLTDRYGYTLEVYFQAGSPIHPYRLAATGRVVMQGYAMETTGVQAG